MGFRDLVAAALIECLMTQGVQSGVPFPFVHAWLFRSQSQKNCWRCDARERWSLQRFRLVGLVALLRTSSLFRPSAYASLVVSLLAASSARVASPIFVRVRPADSGARARRSRTIFAVRLTSRDGCHNCMCTAYVRSWRQLNPSEPGSFKELFVSRLYFLLSFDIVLWALCGAQVTRLQSEVQLGKADCGAHSSHAQGCHGRTRHGRKYVVRWLSLASDPCGCHTTSDMVKPWSAISHSGYGHLLSTWIVVLMGAMRFLEEDCLGGLTALLRQHGLICVHLGPGRFMITPPQTWVSVFLQLEPHSHSLRSADGWNS